MNKTSKRILGIALVALLIAVALVGAGSATTMYYTSEQVGAGLTASLVYNEPDNPENGIFKITGEGAMKNYEDGSNQPWATLRNEIKYADIGYGVTSIGGYAFSLINLTSITIPDTVTSIGDGAFANCSSLTSITIPDTVTSIGDCAFAETGLTSFTIPGNVTTIGEMAFYSCSSLSSVTIPDSVTSIGCAAFGICSNLKSVTINSSTSLYGNNAFAACHSDLVIVYTPCSNPDSSFWDNVYFDDPFSDPTVKVIIPVYLQNMAKDAIPSAAANCYVAALGGCYIDDRFNAEGTTLATAGLTTTDGKEIKEWVKADGTTKIQAFSSGNTRAFPVWEDIDWKVSGGIEWKYCAGTLTIKAAETPESGYTPGQMINYDYEYEPDVPWYDVRENITTLSIGNSVTTIGNNAFNYCINLKYCNSDTEFVIPNNVTTIGEGAFMECSSLENVTFENNSQLTSIEKLAFYSCSNLTSITIPEDVKSIGYAAFRECSNLTLVAIEGNPLVEDYAFADCSQNPVFYLTKEIENTTDMTYRVYLNGGKLNSGFAQEEKKLPAASKLTKDGYTFGGWYDDAGLTTEHTSPEVGTSPVYAKWNASTVHVTGVTLNKTNMTLTNLGDTETLAATIAPENATDKSVTWESSNPAVATVSSTGVVNGVGVGNATITVTTTDGGKTAICNVAVGVPVTGVTLNKDTSKIAVGKTEVLIATVEPGTATIKTVTWSSSDTTVATVIDGIVTAISNGTATITAKSESNPDAFDTCEVTVYTPSSGSSVTSFFGEKNSNDFTFSNAVVITKMTLPGATYAKVTNTSGSGWYNCNLSTDGNAGVAYFQVPLDVLNVKGYTVNDVSLIDSVTTYLGTTGTYAKYSAPVTGSGAYSIAFVKGAATAAVESPVTDTQGYLKITSIPAGATIQIDGVDYIGYTPQEKISLNPGIYTVTLSLDGYEDTVKTVIISDDATSTVTADLKQKSGTTATTTAKSPFPVLGILAGLGIAGFVALRRR